PPPCPVSAGRWRPACTAPTRTCRTWPTATRSSPSTSAASTPPYWTAGWAARARWCWARPSPTSPCCAAKTVQEWASGGAPPLARNPFCGSPELDQPPRRQALRCSVADKDRPRQPASGCGTRLTAIMEFGAVPRVRRPKSASGRFLMNEQWRSRITIEPGKRGGRPCIRGMRITVYDVLSYLAAGMTVAEVLDDFPYLT